MNHITIEELLKAGAHFGHPTSRWNPKFKNYITMKKNGVYIIDLEQTSRCMVKASQELTQIVRDGGNVLFVGTRNKLKMRYNRQQTDVVCTILLSVGWAEH